MVVVTVVVVVVEYVVRSRNDRWSFVEATESPDYYRMNKVCK